MKPIVLVGHKHHCPVHGEGEVISGHSATLVNGRAVACVGDRISCGAVIETGSASHSIEGRAVARLGDTTSHGGTLTEGDAGWLVD
ncbi:PAAR domain-containing protein [Pseudomonas sp. GD03858]|uniref:PAAR domain-containing protein n=1 Tax=unclassified Pseudomonas TaxID=196821 RepID=UPI00244BADB6|nr:MULTISPECIES: PAAR domain-containing protein [unclassified Pseudomonas]MDH0650229.1 PAAR domain-containing protein [Pseudomonas sp. GD03867]MDH0664222.1 PAAR domain-containing protein [Pseudomonas sp. GD03858]